MADDDRLSRQSELFTVRLWPEELGEGQIEWRGRVQHALSGRASYFRGWPGLVTFLSEFLDAEVTGSRPQRET